MMPVDRAFLMWLRVYRELAEAERALREGEVGQDSRLRVLALQSRCARALEELQEGLRRVSRDRGSPAP